MTERTQRRPRMARIRQVLGRAAPWRIGAALAAAGLCALLLMAGPGSVEVLAQSPLTASAAARMPGWTEPCVAVLGLDPDQQAFCARVDGRVIVSQTKSNGETHLVVTGGLHVTLVELRPGIHLPSWGSRIVAVGQLLAPTHGLREVKALTIRQA